MNVWQVQTLTNVVSLVYLARQLTPQNLFLEEDLFHLLVEIYRSPEAIIVWTDEALLDAPPPPADGGALGAAHED